MLPAWAWVLLFGGIALFGAALLAVLVWRLWGKLRALAGEVDVALGRLGELADLAGRIEIPERLLGSDPYVVRPESDSDLTGSAHEGTVRRT